MLQRYAVAPSFGEQVRWAVSLLQRLVRQEIERLAGLSPRLYGRYPVGAWTGGQWQGHHAALAMEQATGDSPAASGQVEQARAHCHAWIRLGPLNLAITL
jgi:hypothetical protein